MSSLRRRDGRIKVFDSLTDTTPTVFADLNVNVYNFWDRGLLGLALDPNFPTDPYVYVLYTYDHELGSAAPAPRWGTPGVYSDPCPSPPGPTADGCVVSGRLSRLQASGNVMTGHEQVLIEDWCQQYPSHSIGALDFGPGRGALRDRRRRRKLQLRRLGAGRHPAEPVRRSAGRRRRHAEPADRRGRRAAQPGPTHEPATRRAWTARCCASTRQPAPGCPTTRTPPAPTERAADHRLRPAQPVPVRRTARAPARCGSATWAGTPGRRSTGSSCRPARGGRTSAGRATRASLVRQSGYDAANLNICENLYTAGTGAVQAPHFAWNHSALVVPGETCPTGSSSAAGIAFGPTRRQLPERVPRSAVLRRLLPQLHLGDAPRRERRPRPAPGSARSPRAPPTRCTSRSGPAATSSTPTSTAAPSAASPSPRQTSPRPRSITASPTTGPAPLTVSFNGTGSSDPDGDPLTYAWDLDGDGTFDDSTAATASYTYTSQGVYTAGLRVTDNQGARDTDSVTITVGNTPPTATIDAPRPAQPGRSATSSTSPDTPPTPRTARCPPLHSPGN